jgi:hypothetical protein
MIERMGPLTAKISASVGESRFATFVLVAFAVLALGLATTGLYGVLSYISRSVAGKWPCALPSERRVATS